MSRDHRRLRVFADAQSLALAIYKETNQFPKEEWFSMRNQMRRAPVSVPSNIVEGCARHAPKDYCNFINVAVGSACEPTYLIQLAGEPQLWPPESSVSLRPRAECVVRQLKRLHSEVDGLAQTDLAAAKAQGPQPKA